MKFIKKFESLSPQSRYIKNRFILFSKKHLKIDFVKEILNQYDVNPVSESTKPSLVPSALKVCTLRNEVEL